MEYNIIQNPLNKILVLGYYDRGNLGDETYKQVIKKYLPHHQIDFTCVDDISILDDLSIYDCIIVGGGDIVNDYFFNKIIPILNRYDGPKFAVSIGIPFPSLITTKYFEIFDHVFVRNYEDIRDIQKIVGSYKAHFMPDLAFLLDCPTHEIKNEIIKQDANNDMFARRASSSIGKQIVPQHPGKKCGIYLVQNLIRFPSIVRDISRLVNSILNNYHVIFYLFNTSNSGSENDTGISKEIIKNVKKIQKKKISRGIHTSRRYTMTVDTTIYHPNDMLHQMIDLDFAVCMRYHAHIYCMLANVPFMSISSTRKTRSLMKYADLVQYQYEIPLDYNSNPTESNYSTMKQIYKITQSKIDALKIHLPIFVKKCKFLLDNNQLENIISHHSDISVADHVNKYLSTYDDYDGAARLMSHLTIGYPDSEYVWGIVDKMKNKVHDCIDGSINYLSSMAKWNPFGETVQTIPIYVDLPEYRAYHNVHRGGWYLAIEELSKHMSQNGILCDMYLDRTFHWCSTYLSYRGILPYTVPWCGFIHHTMDETQSKFNVIELFKKQDFLQSLNTCVMLFTLSPSLTIHIRAILKRLRYDINVVTFMHPIVDPSHLFSFKRQKKIVQIGSWLRNYFTIYTIKNDAYQKNILIGKDMTECVYPHNFSIRSMSDYVPSDEKIEYYHSCITPCRGETGHISRWIKHFIEWLKHDKRIQNIAYDNGTVYIKCHNMSREESTLLDLHKMTQSVSVINQLSNEDYDVLLSQSIVFLHLIDAAAVNTVIECIVRNTPILINKIPGTVDLLGDEYPLFYDEIDIRTRDIGSLLNDSRIEKAHKYLKKMDKSIYKIDYFTKQIADVMQPFQ